MGLSAQPVYPVMKSLCCAGAGPLALAMDVQTPRDSRDHLVESPRQIGFGRGIPVGQIGVICGAI